MAVKTLYLLNSLFAGSAMMALQDGGSPPATATTGTGWTVGTTAATAYALLAAGFLRASSVFGATVLPTDVELDPTLGDAWEAGPFTGQFAAGTWTITIPVVAVSSGGDQDGALRARLWVSDQVDGSKAREVTLGPLVSSAVTNLTPGSPQTCTITFNPGRFGLQAEYLFLQLAWVISGAGGAADRDVLIRVGSASKIVTPDFSSTPNGDAVVRLLVDWDDDGDFDETDVNGDGVSEDLSTDGLEVSCFTGRQSGRLTEQVAAGWFRATVENLSGSLAAFDGRALGKYSPFARSVNFDHLPATDRKVQFRSMVPVVDYLWTGTLVDLRPVTGRDGQAKAYLEALGPLSELAVPEISLAPTRAEDLITTGGHVGRVADAAGWSATARDIDDGDVYVGVWSPQDLIALDAIHLQEDVELGLARESKRGDLVFESRSRRLTRPASVTSAQTFTDDIVLDVHYTDLVPSGYSFMRTEVFDVVNYVLPAFVVDTNLGVLWTYTEADYETSGRLVQYDVFIPAGASRAFTATFGLNNLNNQFVDQWTTPVVGTDILFDAPIVAGDLAVSNVEKAGNQMKFTVTNNAAVTAHLTRIMARGFRAQAVDPQKVTVGSGKRTYPRPGQLYRSTSDAQSAGQLLMNRHRLNRPVLVMPMDSRMSTAQLVQCFRREVSDRVIVEGLRLKTRLGISNMACYIEGIGQDFRMTPDRGLEMQTTFVLSAVQPLTENGAPLTAGENPTNYWILGTGALGSTTVLN